MAFFGQVATQVPQPLHDAGTTYAFSTILLRGTRVVPKFKAISCNCIAPKGHTSTHAVHPIHFLWSTSAVIPSVSTYPLARSRTARPAAPTPVIWAKEQQVAPFD